MRIEFFYRWYDLWVGAYVDTKNEIVYVCCLGLGFKVILDTVKPQ